MGFGKELKRLREASGISAAKLAELADIDAVRLRNWEVRDTEPNAQDRKKIEDFFDEPLDQIKDLEIINPGYLQTNPEGYLPPYDFKPKSALTLLGEGYKRGQRFSKILGGIIERGTPLEVLRDKIFKVKGRQLSKMYLGLSQVPGFVIEILERDFNVNVKYLDDPYEEIFKKPSIVDTTNIPLDICTVKFYETDFGEGKQKNELNPKVLNWNGLLKNSQYVMTIKDNSMMPNYHLGSIIGISEVSDKEIVPGSVYLLEKENGLLLRRLYYVDDNQQLEIFECISDNNMVYEEGGRKGKLYFPPFTISKGEIKKLFKIMFIHTPIENNY